MSETIRQAVAAALLLGALVIEAIAVTGQYRFH